jgi:cation diffusion facilitator family transporter
MATASSKTVLFAAMAGHIAIATTKFIAASVTGSSAMFAEGVHSLVDTGNGILLLWGIHRSNLPPDELHPFGHGKELYFWALIVAVLIFALGGGISINEGIQQLRQPTAVVDPIVNYIVLAIAFVFEGSAWWIALREFRKTKGALGYLQAVRESKDPTIFTVLFEDSAAMLGLTAAFLGVSLGYALGIPQLDGAASVAIGLLLCGIAFFLAYESKGLLIGEGVASSTRESIDRIVKSDPDIDRVVRVLSMHFGPQDVLLVMEIAFRPDLTAAYAATAVERLDKAIRDRHPEIRHIFVEAQSMGQRPTPLPH